MNGGLRGTRWRRFGTIGIGREYRGLFAGLTLLPLKKLWYAGFKRFPEDWRICLLEKRGRSWGMGQTPFHIRPPPPPPGTKKPCLHPPPQSPFPPSFLAVFPEAQEGEEEAGNLKFKFALFYFSLFPWESVGRFLGGEEMAAAEAEAAGWSVRRRSRD